MPSDADADLLADTAHPRKLPGIVLRNIHLEQARERRDAVRRGHHRTVESLTHILQMTSGWTENLFQLYDFGKR